MKSLRIVLHNKENRPIFMDFMIPDELAKVIEGVKVTRAEFLISDKSFRSLPDFGNLGTKIVRPNQHFSGGQYDKGLNDFRTL